MTAQLVINGWRDVPETSVAQGLDHCNGCGKCCENGGCTLASGDGERVAAHLGVTLREFYREHTVFTDTDVRMKTPCNFYVEKQCAIHDVKPTGGAAFECWAPTPAPMWRLADLQRAARKAGTMVLAR